MTGTQPRNEGRDGRVWHMYAVEQRIQEDIAAELGLSQSRVSAIIRKVRGSIPAPVREDIIKERLEQLRAVATQVATRAFATGDSSDIASLIKIQEREAKLLGLDAATKTDVSGELVYRIVGINTDDLA